MCFGNKAVNDKIAQRQGELWSGMTKNVFGVNPTQEASSGAAQAAAVPQTAVALGNSASPSNAVVTNVAGSSAALTNPAAQLITSGEVQKNKRQFGVNI